jgi:hypothetical protein
MLRPPGKDDPLQQGDIIGDVPFLLLPRVVNLKGDTGQGQVRLDSQDAGIAASLEKVKSAKTIQATVPVVFRTGLVITQTCDIEHKSQITLAHVLPLDAMVQEVKEAAAHDEPLVLYDIIRSLTEGLQYTHLVYLGAPGGTQRLVADLLQVQSFERPWKEYFKRQRLAALSDEGLKYLQGRLNLFTGRYATEAGFWRMPDDQELADRIEKDPSAVEAAYERLRKKTEASGRPG